jgi:nitrite reductase/ring-hydroxylating ferredoxin subunit
MLSHEDNELLSRVGKGTPMGAVMRSTWLPLCRKQFLEADGAPRRMRLLGEDLVAFRATDGRVGVRDEKCPHRLCSLALARNEENGLRCIYHGWKFDVSGEVVEVPTEPADRAKAFAATVPRRHKPVREAGGIVWVWLGEGEPAPFYNFNWLTIPDEQIEIRVGNAACSWLNGLETALDTAHVGVLHTNAIKDDSYIHKTDTLALCTDDFAPHFEFEMKPYGYREAAMRNLEGGSKYLRLREFVMPFFSYIPVGPRDNDQLLTMYVPIDDYHSAHWDIRYNLVGPKKLTWFAEDDPDDYMASLGTIDNLFGQDREAMKNGSWTGLGSIRHEDSAVGMSQGAIPDRTQEFLSSSDLSIVRGRRLLLKAARAAAAGDPHGIDPGHDMGELRAIEEVLAPGDDWRVLQP